MNQRTKFIVLTALLSAAALACAETKNTVRIKVLDSASRSITTESNGAPANCDLSNYDAYCHGSKAGEVIYILLVQEGDEPPFRIRCSNDARWSRSKCIPLTKGETFEATKEKHGLTVYYMDDDGKLRKQLYTYVLEDGNGNPLPAALPRGAKANPIPAENAENIVQEPAAPASARSSLQPVKCSFSSTPSGAEVTLDGQYVGSTPSVLDVTTGKHVVAITMPGFAAWKRELTVSAGSELTVNANLQKSQ